MNYQLTTQEEVRQDYWRELAQINPKLHAKAKREGIGTDGEYLPQNKQPCTIRCDFVEYVDSLERNGAISRELASNVTL